MKLIKKIVLHLIIIIIVTIFPVLVYEFMSNHECGNFAYIGGISYFIYCFYLVLKIKKYRLKIILLGILWSLLALYIGSILSEINTFIPIVLLIINLIFQSFLLKKNPKHANQVIWKSYQINFVITIILTILFTFTCLIVMFASTIPAIRY